MFAIAAEPTILERQNRELAVLNSIATALNESVDLRASLSSALSGVADLLGLDAGWVWLLDEATGEPYLAAAQNLPDALLAEPTALQGSCHCLDAFHRGVFGDAANVVTCSRLRYLPGEADGLRFHASIPLRTRERRLGVMNVANPEWRELSRDELRLLHTIGDMLSVAIERARLIARSVEMAALEERNRLAREIHDTLAQGLSATGLQLETADALLEAGADPARVRELVNRALRTTRENLEEARRSVLDLRAAPLEGRSLAEAVQALCASASHADGLDVRCHLEGGTERLPSRIELALYRVAQEALTNVRKHAAARHVSVRLASEAERITLSVEDDGCGFEAKACPGTTFGFQGMCERLRLLSGTLRVESAPGVGTRILASIPLS